MYRYFLFILFFFACFGVLFATPSIAVIDFDSGSFCTVQEAIVMTNAFRNEMVRSGRATIVDRANTEALRAEMRFQMSDWVNPARIRTAGNMLGVDYFIFGNFGIMGGTGYLQVQMTEVDTGHIIHSARISLRTWQEFDQRVGALAREFSDKIPTPNILLGTWRMLMQQNGGNDTYRITFLTETSCTVNITRTINRQSVSQEATGIYSYDGEFLRLTVVFNDPVIPELDNIQWMSVLTLNETRTSFNILIRTTANAQTRVTFMKE